MDFIVPQSASLTISAAPLSKIEPLPVTLVLAGNGRRSGLFHCIDEKVCGCHGADADKCQRIHQEDHHPRTGQVWWQAQTEGGDHLQLRGRGGNPRAGRIYDCGIYPWTQKNGVTFTVTPFSAQPQDL